MTTCSSCGHEIAEGVRFCPSCGTRVAADAAPSGDPLVGRTLNDKYRLVERIGAGSMGTVYLAEHIGLQKRVALKVLRPDLDVGEETLQRFQREGIAAGRFTHPNAIQIFDFDRAGDRLFYLAMEFVEGSNLKEFLAAEGRLAPAEAVDAVRQILSALAEAHRHGIVHRDLKPENVMVARDPSGALAVKVLDFGLSKLVHMPLGASLRTEPGRIMGTPLYMAPEQAAGDEVDHRSDLYSAALILFELLSGEPPFRAESMTELITKQVTEPAPSLRESHPALRVPTPLDDLLGRALEKRPDDRFQSAAEMTAALDAADLADFGGSRFPRSRPRAAAAAARAAHAPDARGSLALLVKVAAAAFVVLAVAGVLFFLNVSGTAAEAPARLSARAPDSLTPEERHYVDLLAEARRDLKAGALDAALDRVVEAHDRACRDAEAFLVRGLVYRARSDRDAAAADLREALRADPAYAEAAAELGWLRLDAGDLEAAAGRFDEALAIDPACAAALAGRGAALGRAGDPDAARPLLAEAAERDPGDARAPRELGRLLFAAGDVAGARDALVRAKLNDPRSWETLADLARAYLAEGRAEDAETQLREALRVEPDALPAALDLGALLVDARRAPEALDVLAERVRRHPDWTAGAVLLACALDDLGRAGEAVDALERATATGAPVNGGDPRAHTLLGVLHLEAGRHAEALAALDAALAADERNAVAHLDRGLCLFALGDYEGAARALERAVDLEPEDAFAHYTLGVVYMDYLAAAEDALLHLEAYDELDGSDPRVRGWIERLRGRG